MTAPPQNMVALAQANKVRLARCELRHQLAEGLITAAEVIQAPPECAVTMTVRDVLVCQHRWGRHRALRLLVVAQVREGKTLGSLTDRQRRVLVDLLVWGTAAKGLTV